MPNNKKSTYRLDAVCVKKQDKKVQICSKELRDNAPDHTSMLIHELVGLKFYCNEGPASNSSL